MMWLLILGVLIWSLVHFFPSVQPAKRAELVESLGSKYQGLFALAILLSIVMMVIGWRNTIPEPVFNPPLWGRHLTMLLVLVAVILFGAANGRSRVRQFVRHPMLAGMIVWGIAHLLANGDIRSVILFGGMILWAAISIILINRRDGTGKKVVVAEGWGTEIKLLGISLVVYLALLFLHPYFTGMSVMTR